MPTKEGEKKKKEDCGEKWREGGREKETCKLTHYIIVCFGIPKDNDNNSSQENCKVTPEVQAIVTQT